MVRTKSPIPFGGVEGMGPPHTFHFQTGGLVPSSPYCVPRSFACTSAGVRIEDAKGGALQVKRWGIPSLLLYTCTCVRFALHLLSPSFGACASPPPHRSTFLRCIGTTCRDVCFFIPVTRNFKKKVKNILFLITYGITMVSSTYSCIE